MAGLSWQRCRSVLWRFCERYLEPGYPERSEAGSKDPDRVILKVSPPHSSDCARNDADILKLACECVCFAHRAGGLAGAHGQTNRTRQRNRTHSFDSASMGNSHPWATCGIVTR